MYDFQVRSTRVITSFSGFYHFKIIIHHFTFLLLSQISSKVCDSFSKFYKQIQTTKQKHFQCQVFFSKFDDTFIFLSCFLCDWPTSVVFQNWIRTVFRHIFPCFSPMNFSLSNIALSNLVVKFKIWIFPIYVKKWHFEGTVISIGLKCNVCSLNFTF